MPADQTALGQRIRKLRRRRRLTQAQLGAGFSPSYISAVERGQITPSLEALQGLAERLGVPLVRLLEDDAATTATITLTTGDAAGADAASAGAVGADLSLGKWVNQELLRRGWRQTDFAGRAGMTPGTLSAVLQGRVGPSARRCREIARALRVPAVVVFRVAGLLPAVTASQAEQEELLGYLDLLGPQQRRLLLSAARAWVQDGGAGAPE